MVKPCIIIYSTAYSTAVLRVACSHTHTLAYGSDVNELGHTVGYEAEAANILPLLQDAPVIISVSPIAYKLRA